MRSKNPGWYRSPRTTQERRATPRRAKYGRPRRNFNNLPTTYDDIRVSVDRRCWKSKRKTQYRPGGRGKCHELFFDELKICYYSYEYWDLANYFEKHDIPYRIETVRREVVRQELITHEWKKVGWMWRYRWIGHTKINGISHEMTIKERADRFDWVPVEIPYYKERRWHQTIGYKVTYWTNKKLDLRGYIA